MAYNPFQLKSIARLQSAKGFKFFGRYLSQLNGKRVVETTFRNPDGFQMKVVKDAETGRAITTTVSNEFGSYTRTPISNGDGQVSWNELFKTADGTILSDTGRQTIWHEGRKVFHNGEFVSNWSARQIVDTKKAAFLDRLGQLIGYDSHYSSILYESLEPGNANIREMLSTDTARTLQQRGITLLDNARIYATDNGAIKLPRNIELGELQKFTGELHLWRY